MLVELLFSMHKDWKITPYIIRILGGKSICCTLYGREMDTDELLKFVLIVSGISGLSC